MPTIRSTPPRAYLSPRLRAAYESLAQMRAAEINPVNGVYMTTQTENIGGTAEVLNVESLQQAVEQMRSFPWRSTPAYTLDDDDEPRSDSLLGMASDPRGVYEGLQRANSIEDRQAASDTLRGRPWAPTMTAKKTLPKKPTRVHKARSFGNWFRALEEKEGILLKEETTPAKKPRVRKKATSVAMEAVTETTTNTEMTDSWLR